MITPDFAGWVLIGLAAAGLFAPALVRLRRRPHPQRAALDALAHLSDEPTVCVRGRFDPSPTPRQGATR